MFKCKFATLFHFYANYLTNRLSIKRQCKVENMSLEMRSYVL